MKYGPQSTKPTSPKLTTQPSTAPTPLNAALKAAFDRGDVATVKSLLPVAPAAGQGPNR